jgi:hypothetical protein
LGYEGFDAGFPGFLLWSGSALTGQTSKNQPYSGVGLELYANTSSYFRYSTSDNEIDIRTENVFIGSSATYISASNGNFQISSSGLNINNGNIEASSIVIKRQGLTLLDTNTGYADGTNVVREIPVTAIDTDSFNIFLDGETKISILAYISGSGTLGMSWSRLINDTLTSPKLDSGTFTTSTYRVVRHLVDLTTYGNTSPIDITNTVGFFQLKFSAPNTGAMLAFKVFASRAVGSSGLKGDNGGGTIIDTV